MDKLDPTVAGLVLLAALMHASWNAVVKSDPDRLASFGLVMLAGCVLGAILAPFVGVPAPESWGYLLASVLIHCVYYYFLLKAYAVGDLSHVYPIARGLGPTLVAVFSGALIGEYLSLRETAGVVLVSLGIAGLALARGMPSADERRATALAVMTGITIAAYTVVDAMGARASGNALGYIAWLNILEGPWVFVVACLKRGGAIVPYIRKYWWRGTAGGMVAAIGYGIAIWATSVSPVAHISALRETSVLFATLMGTLLLGESFGRKRVAAALLMVCGLLLMNFKLG
ncbi:MAG: EamA family transporter [Azospirillum sp.]|nr:EamA family transporter [Azospirillum sp.]MCZ8123458.1 EamA family transporter [Magnetospirillum sp.]